jgi:hypothetical protein
MTGNALCKGLAECRTCAMIVDYSTLKQPLACRPFASILMTVTGCIQSTNLFDLRELFIFLVG